MNKTVVGKLYMVGCGHCDALVEPWKQMKEKVEKKVMVAGDIEAAENHKLDELNKQHGSKVEVQGGYPTIYKIKRGGKVEYYNGERTASKLIGWALQGKQSFRNKKSKKRHSRRHPRRHR